MKLIINSIKLTIAVAALTAVASVFIPQRTIYAGCDVSIATRYYVGWQMSRKYGTSLVPLQSDACRWKYGITNLQFR